MLLLLALLGCPRPDALEAALDAPAPITAEQADPLSDVSLPDLPLWTNKYAPTRDDYGRFFALTTLMQRYELSRLQAIEVQNHFRDAHRADPTASELALFDAAVAQVKAGDFESGADANRLAAAPFIVVFDLDETLYDQYYPAALGEACHTARWEADGATRAVQMAPGWDELIRAIRGAGGEVALFSANQDELTLDNLRHLTLNGVALADSPDIAAVMTNSYLMMQSKTEGPGALNPSKGEPVITPSKDLRILDDSLQRVILIDDNPTRLFQMANTRVTRKFHADAWCSPNVDPTQKAAFESTLPTVQREVLESVAAMKASDIPFQQAFLPYTDLGQRAMAALMIGNSWDEPKARAALRANPGLADSKY